MTNAAGDLISGNGRPPGRRFTDKVRIQLRAALSWVRSVCQLEYGASLFERLGRSTCILFSVVTLFLVVWQSFFAFYGDQLDDAYQNRAASGMVLEREAPFLYFWYYLNIYPLAPHSSIELKHDDYSDHRAKQILDSKPGNLITDIGAQIRKGEHVSRALLLFDAWLKGSPESVSMLPGNFVGTCFAVAALFLGFAIAGHPVLGLFLAILFGSNPFLLHEMYGRDNMLGWPLVIAGMTLGVSAPALFSKHSPSLRLAVWTAIICGLIIAIGTQIRTDAGIVLAGLAFLFVSVPGWAWKPKLLCTGILVLTAFLTIEMSHLYWQSRTKEALSYRAVYNIDEFQSLHLFWHPVWLGLSDFDEKYGIEWNDGQAFELARPHLLEEYGDKFEKRPRPHFSPEYSDFIRQDFFAKVTSDPAWYGEILAKRAWRILTETVPVRIAALHRHVTLPYINLCIPFMLLAIALLHAWLPVRLILFGVPLSMASLLIFSGRGMTSYSVFHILTWAVLLAIAVEVALRLARSLSHGVSRLRLR